MVRRGAGEGQMSGPGFHRPDGEKIPKGEQKLGRSLKGRPYMKTAIVTGASKGIGRAIALRLAREGASVVACAPDSAALEQTGAETESSGGSAHTIALYLRA